MKLEVGNLKELPVRLSNSKQHLKNPISSKRARFRKKNTVQHEV
jgi:hypothetical protein